jgi:type I restriction-modification system DNA methylase subunit
MGIKKLINFEVEHPRKEGQMRKLISSETLKDTFGAKSRIYSVAIDKLGTFWKAVKNEKNVEQMYNSWKKSMEIVYGDVPKENLFLTHTYLAVLVKLAMYLYFERTPIDKEKLMNVINGEYFSSIGISNFSENDFSIWILHDKIISDSLDLVYWLAQLLSEYDFSHINEDIFKEIYEELIEKEERHKAGEYYTPEWLAQLILSEVFSIWKKEHEKTPKILDPACGSGTFLCNAIRFFKEEYSNSISLEDILNNIIGIDVNPLACLIAKANYLIALGDAFRMKKHKTNITIPIFLGDALKLSNNTLQEVDMIVGNPPWIVMRNIRNKEYQEYLKREVLRYNLLDKKDVHLFTQIEMATLFFYKCSDLYLKNNGIIAFVMPRSVIGGTIQHVNFRRFQNPPLKLIKILDLENVHPLFNMPACVLIALKGKVTEYPVVAIKYNGELPRKNSTLQEVKNLLSMEQYAYSPPKFPTVRSYYFDKFKVGASIFPRTLYFIDIISSADGFITAQTSKEILKVVKPPWKVELKGKIESQFIYSTLLAQEIMPFGYLKLRPIILPVINSNGRFQVLDFSELKELGYIGVSRWFEEAQKLWEEKRTPKSAKRFPRLIDRLNYGELLTSQNPNKRYVVVYNATGSDVVSCVVDRKFIASLERLSNGFIVDVKTWFYETDNESEAYYLSAILNSELISKLIKPFQPQGLFGARAIHRRPLLFAIPKFEEDNGIHLELAKMGKLCHEKVRNMLSYKKIKGKITRSQVRKNLHDEIKHINNLVTELLETHTSESQKKITSWLV